MGKEKSNAYDKFLYYGREILICKNIFIIDDSPTSGINSTCSNPYLRYLVGSCVQDVAVTSLILIQIVSWMEKWVISIAHGPSEKIYCAVNKNLLIMLENLTDPSKRVCYQKL